MSKMGAHVQAARCNPVPNLSRAPWGCPEQTAGPDPVSSARQRHWLTMSSGNTQGQRQPALATMQRVPHRHPRHSPEARHARGREWDSQEGHRVCNNTHPPSVKGPRRDIPFAGTESSDGSYSLKLPVNIYHAFAKAQPNFNHQIDIVLE